MSTGEVSMAKTRVILGAQTNGFGRLVSGAVVDVDEALIGRLKQLQSVCTTEELVRVVATGAPDMWLPMGVATEERFNLAQLNVSTDGVWFEDQAKHADDSVQTRWISIDMLEGLFKAYPGETMWMREGGGLSQVGTGLVAMDQIGEAMAALEEAEATTAADGQAGAGSDGQEVVA